MSAISVLVFVPYMFWILWLFASNLNEPFSWDYVHGPEWNSVVKVPAYGEVRVDKWGQVATGFAAFVIFGTGTDANNTYKRMLCALGLGKIFPRLYVMHESGSSTPRSFRAARGWVSSQGSKAWRLFSKKSDQDTLQSTTASTVPNNSVTSTLETPGSTSFRPVESYDPILSQQERANQQHHQPTQGPNHGKSIYNRLFSRRDNRQPILPLFSRKKSYEMAEAEKSPTETIPPGSNFRAHVSVPRNSNADQAASSEGVIVVREVYQKDSSRHSRYSNEGSE